MHCRRPLPKLRNPSKIQASTTFAGSTLIVSEGTCNVELESALKTATDYKRTIEKELEERSEELRSMTDEFRCRSFQSDSQPHCDVLSAQGCE